MNKLKNPLEEVFNMQELPGDVESGYAVAEVPSQQQDAIALDQKDEDDVMVEKRIDEVYSAAIDAFKNQLAYVEVIEPRYAARNAEVAANYLSIALAAANSRAKVKVDRKRANATFTSHDNSSKKITNNILVADRNEILKMITVDSDVKEVK